ncbi:MAG TPA: class I SAM-dependent methyltransferase [Caulobacteraceae bacterium]
MSDPHKSVLIAYEAMGFCNPLSPETLDRTLAWAGLKPGMRTLDLGCGNAAMSIHMAETYGVHIDALERSPKVSAIARKRLEGRGAPGKVTLHNVEAVEFLEGAKPYDLVVAVGASGIADPPEPQAIMEALKAHVKPGGLLLWSDPYWKADPDPAFVAMIAPYAAYKTHVGNIEAGEAAGLELRYAGASPPHEWDDCIYSMYAASQAWLADHPDDPEAADVRERNEMQRMAYQTFGRETLGFGLYLFRRTPE